MKRILSILFAIIFLYSIVGFYLNFSIEQARIKEEVKEKIINRLPDDELTVIKVTSGDKGKIIWMEKGREFRFGGYMYDIVRTRKGTDTTFYYCFCDVKESRLLSNLDKLVKDQSDHSQSRTIQKKQQINIFFYDVMHVCCLFEAPVHYFNPASGYNFNYNDVITPPPKVLTAIS